MQIGVLAQRSSGEPGQQFHRQIAAHTKITYVEASGQGPSSEAPCFWEPQEVGSKMIRQVSHAN